MIKISFSSDLKSNIYNFTIKKNCCKRAMFFGFLAAKATIEQGGIKLHTNSEQETEYISRSVLELFNRELAYKKRVKGVRGYELFFYCDSALERLEKIIEGEFLYQLKCSSCKSAFLRGIFLAVGRFTNPNKAFHLEFSLGARAKSFISLFNEYDLNPKYIERKKELLLYFKDSTTIGDFFAIMDESKITMDIINDVIRNQYKNYANRRANIESSNILRSVEAGIKQTQIIKKLKESGKLSLLPEELRQTAELRLEYSDISLSALGAMLNPPISKSGVNHRLQKIILLAETL